MESIDDKLNYTDKILKRIASILKTLKSIVKDLCFYVGAGFFPVKYIFFNNNSKPELESQISSMTNNVPYVVNTNTNYMMLYQQPDQHYYVNFTYQYQNGYDLAITVLAMIMLFTIVIKIINLFNKK